MILIVGVTGVLGRIVALRLVAAGHAVRGVTRDPASTSASDLAARGIEIVHGDLVDRDSLEAACRGVDTLLAAAHQLRGTGVHDSEAVDHIGHRSLIDVARGAGVHHIVYTSAQHASLDHPVDFHRTKAKVEAYLRASGASHTILRPSAFMEWHVHRLLGAELLATGRVTLFGSGDNPINFVAATDVARVAATALTDPRSRTESIEIGGPDQVTKNEIVALYGRAASIAPACVNVPLEAMHAARQRPGIDAVLDRLMAFGIWTDSTDQTFEADPPADAVPLVRVEDFVRAQVDLHRATKDAS